jgi:toxin ParE1/3/4
MGFQIVYTKPALADIEALVTFIARDNARAAEEFGNALVDKAETLANHPFLGRVVPEFKIESTREIVYRPYRIIYRVNSETQLIQILRVWHAARGIPKVKG